MTKKEVIDFLITYNKWRRGSDIMPQPHPTLIGETIDWVIDYLRSEEIGVIKSPSGQVWMDRNVGAKEVGDNGDYFSHDEALKIIIRGFRLPTAEEWKREIDTGGLESLNLPLAGHCNFDTRSLFFDTKSLYYAGSRGHYWSSSVSGRDVRSLHFINSGYALGSYSRMYGFSVRLIKD